MSDSELSRVSEMIMQRDAFTSALHGNTGPIHDAALEIARCFKRGNKLLICGNGGSAADSQHMAAEFVGRFEKDRHGLPAIALTTDTSALTAIGNDWEYRYVFKRQLEALGRYGDVILGISTSGKSTNVLDALAHAKTMGMKVIGLVGPDDSPMKELCDIQIAVGKERTPIVQERQLASEHIICELVDEMLSEAKFSGVLAEGKRIYCFDIDGTLCHSTGGKYENAKPYQNRIIAVNAMYESGHRIVLYTARGSSTGLDHRELTEQQLSAWGVKYHELRLGKPQYDLMIDDRACSDIDFFGALR